MTVYIANVGTTAPTVEDLEAIAGSVYVGAGISVSPWTIAGCLKVRPPRSGITPGGIPWRSDS